MILLEGSICNSECCNWTSIYGICLQGRINGFLLVFMSILKTSGLNSFVILIFYRMLTLPKNVLSYYIKHISTRGSEFILDLTTQIPVEMFTHPINSVIRVYKCSYSRTLMAVSIEGFKITLFIYYISFSERSNSIEIHVKSSLLTGN